MSQAFKFNQGDKVRIVEDPLYKGQEVRILSSRMRINNRRWNTMDALHTVLFNDNKRDEINEEKLESL